MKTVISLILLLLINFVNAEAQKLEGEFSLKPKNKVENSNCEIKLRDLDVLIQHTKPESSILIISQIGKNERIGFGKRRLYNAKAFFTKVESRYSRPPESVVIAEAERVDGEGHLDFYIQGELNLRINFKKNRDLYIRPCSLNFPDEKYCSTKLEKLFYPCKK